MERKKTDDFKILTNDPSITAWGWVVVQGDIILDSGCIKTTPESKKRRIRKSDDAVRRVQEINMELLRVIDTHDVEYVVSELPHGSQNASAAKMIGIVVGLLQGIGDARGISVEWFSENDAKKCLLGRNSCTKQEVISRINSIYKVPWTGIKYKDEAVADALAVYYAAGKLSTTIQMMCRMGIRNRDKI